jgi:type I restriction enzyme S subunit
MPFGLKDKDINLIKNVFHLHSKVKEVLIFGSRAMGTERLGSDIDLAVKGENITTSDILKIRTQLDELKIAYECDVVNYHNIKTPEFVEHIDKHGIVFYQRQEKPSNWKKYKLGEFAELRKEQIIPNGKEQPYIGLEHIEQQSLRLNGIGSSNDVISNKFKFYSDDILYGKLRPYFRKVYKPTFDGVCSTDIYVIKNKSVVDKDFLFYLVATEEFTSIANSGSSGTRMPRADWNQLINSEWLIPESIEEQIQIAQILTSLDDKIELNLQMNKTLEAMAQAIFKEWFVNFNFPGFDGELVDGLPRGWKREPIDENIEFLNGLALQKFPPLNDDDFLSVIKIRELKQGFTNASDKASTELPEKYIIEDGDILFSWSGSLEVVLWCEGRGALNQHLFKVSSNVYPKWFYFFWVREYLPLYKSIAEGKATTMGHIQRRHLTDSMINIPNKELMNLADSILSPIIDKIQEKKIQIQTLTQTRDTLLPKLMSGKIKIK